MAQGLINGCVWTFYWLCLIEFHKPAVPIVCVSMPTLDVLNLRTSAPATLNETLKSISAVSLWGMVM